MGCHVSMPEAIDGEPSHQWWPSGQKKKARVSVPAALLVGAAKCQRTGARQFYIPSVRSWFLDKKLLRSVLAS